MQGYILLLSINYTVMWDVCHRYMFKRRVTKTSKLKRAFLFKKKTHNNPAPLVLNVLIKCLHNKITKHEAYESWRICSGCHQPFFVRFSFFFFTKLAFLANQKRNFKTKTAQLYHKIKKKTSNGVCYYWRNSDAL